VFLGFQGCNRNVFCCVYETGASDIEYRTIDKV
jgi:hypothetical protein